MNENKILVVEDDVALAEALCDTIELAGYSVAHVGDGEAALAYLARESADLVVTDVQMAPMDGFTLLSELRARYASIPVLIMTAHATVERAVQAMRQGAADYLVKPFEAEVLLEKVIRYLPVKSSSPDALIAEDLRTRELVELARRVASSDAAVMIGGESGTGKEVFARFIHQSSARADGPFVAINCAAIPENMLEAVLFGYEKGAFTGAHRAVPGKFEQAQGGTLLLDEISEMDLGLQAKLLRVLQEREVERLGGSRTIDLDVRVLATSNRKLREEVAAGRFREDLFYRLNVFPLTLAPLRERPRDILPLTEYLLGKHLAPGEAQPTLSQEAQARLLGHRWPGNVRELDNVVQRALILRTGEQIQPQDLCFESEAVPMGESLNPLTLAQPVATAPEAESDRRLSSDLKTVEERMILDALRAGNGSRKHAAEVLGISPRTLRYKIARMREAGVPIPA